MDFWQPFGPGRTWKVPLSTPGNSAGVRIHPPERGGIREIHDSDGYVRGWCIQTGMYFRCGYGIVSGSLLLPGGNESLPEAWPA